MQENYHSYLHMVATGQGKVMEFYFESVKIDMLKTSQGKIKKLTQLEGWTQHLGSLQVISMIFFLNEKGKCVENL